MKLTSHDGAAVELTITDYQFSADVEHESDANWVMIRGAFTTADGQSWTFLQPCMTTHDLPMLADFLDRATDDDTQPSELAFMEPNLEFQVLQADPEQPRLEIRFRHESAPPEANRKAVVLPMELKGDDLRKAAEDWRREMADYPVR